MKFSKRLMCLSLVLVVLIISTITRMRLTILFLIFIRYPPSYGN